MKIKLLIAFQNQLYRELLATCFSRTLDLEVVAEAGNEGEVLDKVGLTTVDVVLMDVFSPGFGGVELTKKLTKQHPETKTVVLSNQFDRNIIKDMLEAKIWGYFITNISFEQLCYNLRHIHSGNKRISPEVQSLLIDDYLDRGTIKMTPLTKRESEILKLLAEGKSINQISEALFISIKTTCTHKQHIFDKMGFENLAQLVRYAYKVGLVS